jgi:hypothetical protein
VLVVVFARDSRLAGVWCGSGRKTSLEAGGKEVLQFAYEVVKGLKKKSRTVNYRSEISRSFARILNMKEELITGEVREPGTQHLHSFIGEFTVLML